ncbi:MAG: ABC transporter ATP-binding protein [bacterium]
MSINIQNLDFKYNSENLILENINLDIKEGKITSLIGANGCGKSTLLKIMSKNALIKKGDVYLNNTLISEYTLKEFAKKLAIVHQKNSAPDDLTVEKLVSYGRIPHKNILNTSNSKEDEEKINWAMEVMDVLDIKDKSVGRLSGGQRQRVFIAMALAQDTKILFLDEPTTFLDVKYQVEILRLVKKLNKEQGITIVMVLHDINQALYYSDEIIALRKGNVYLQGEPSKIINSKTIKDIYDIELEVFDNNGNICVLAI